MFESSWLSRLGLIAAFIAIIAFFAFVFDPEHPSGPPLLGNVVANIEQVSDNPSPESQIRVMLPGGRVVVASVRVGQGFPFAPGATVSVTPYRGRLFGKQSYWIEAVPRQP
jgi:hypothetical protein